MNVTLLIIVLFIFIFYAIALGRLTKVQIKDVKSHEELKRILEGALLEFRFLAIIDKVFKNSNSKYKEALLNELKEVREIRTKLDIPKSAKKANYLDLSRADIFKGTKKKKK